MKRIRINLLAKLLGAFGLVALILGLVAVFLLWQIDNVSRTYQHEALHWQQADAQIGDVVSQINKQAAALRGYLLTQSSDMAMEWRESDNTMNYQLEALGRSVSEQRDIDDVKQLQLLNTQVYQPAERIINLAKEGKKDEALIVFLSEVQPTAREMITIATQLEARLDQH
ncbi:MAG TPA: CHASE3 domain-containing protein, partial [Symbiobacteriaceae bacterium]|nr:CHASE3 domain-containing protein [Symbiobacteriaceae bacterium]